MVSHCIDRLKNGHKTPVAHSLYSNLYVCFQSISRSSIHAGTLVSISPVQSSPVVQWLYTTKGVSSPQGREDVIIKNYMNIFIFHK